MSSTQATLADAPLRFRPSPAGYRPLVADDVLQPPDQPDETDDPEFRDTQGRTPGGVEPETGERGDDESQNADIPAA